MFGAAGGMAGGRITPTRGTATPFVSNDTTDRNVTDISHSSAAGNLLVRLFAKRNGSPATVTVTWGDGSGTVPVVERARGSGATAVSALAWIGVCTGGKTGLGTLRIATPNSVRDMAVRVEDLIDLSDSPIGESGNGAADTPATTVAGTVEVQNEASLLVAVGGFCKGSSAPISLSSGWSADAAVASGGGNQDIACVFASRAPAATGDETLTLTTSTADAEQAVAILELLPI